MAHCKAKEDCEKEAKKLGFCGTHYAQVKRGARSPDGELLRPLRPKYNGQLCKVDDCKRPVLGRGFCNRHYHHFRFNRIDEDGNPTDPSVWKSYYNPNRKTPGKTGPCKLEGCDRDRVDSESGLCGRHYRQLQLGIIDVHGNSLREPCHVRKYKDTDKCRAPGCDRKPVSNWMCKKHTYQLESGIIDQDGNVLRPKSKGGRVPGKVGTGYYRNGYKAVRAPEDHPYAWKDGYIFEHRLVAEQVVGRYIEPHEIVHHKDGDRANNDPQNLEVLPRKKHHKAIEYTEDGVRQALSALRHNDPEAYNRLIKEF